MNKSANEQMGKLADLHFVLKAYTMKTHKSAEAL
jgi:hypothetical protein